MVESKKSPIAGSGYSGGGVRHKFPKRGWTFEAFSEFCGTGDVNRKWRELVREELSGEVSLDEFIRFVAENGNGAQRVLRIIADLLE